MRDLHREITDKILAQLKTGVAPWRKPWSESRTADGVMPFNATSGRAYSGVNVLLLWSAAQANGWGPRWLTFKQAKEAGGTVRGGQHGETVIFVKRMIVKDKDDKTKTKTIGFLRAYTVFNVAQCDGLPDRVMGVTAPVVLNKNERDATVEEFVEATKIRRVEGGAQACYSPKLDVINIPRIEAFKSSDAYYSTLSHEMGHATGHESRLNRSLKGRFGDREYAAEELIAELTSAFVCAEFGIDMGDAPAAYVDNWVSLLEEKDFAIVTAAAAASKAVEWMRGQVSAEDADEGEELSVAA